MQNNNSPKVSICVPVYGVEKYIEKCARSLFEQTYRNIEYVFVDDCSPDNSIAILEETIEKYPSRKACVRIIRHDHNRGLAGSRNTAVAAATGDFIAHVDSDDWLELNAIDILVKKQLETNADIISGDIILHHSNRDEILAEPSYKDKNEMMNEIVRLSLNHTLCKRLIRTSLYKKNAIMAVEGANIGEDHYTLPRLLYFAKSFAKVHDVVYHYNLQNEVSYTQTHDNGFAHKKYDANLKAIDILLDFFSDKDVELVTRIEQIKFEYLYSGLWYTAKFGNKEYFEKFKKMIVPLSHYTSTIDVDKKHLHFVLNHYTIDRLIVLLRILQHKLTKKKKYKL